jgi:hypothetical protein
MADQLLAGIPPVLDENGDPVAGGSITFYQTNTTTPVQIWSNLAATIPLANPITLDSAGRPSSQVFYTGGVEVKEVIKDAGGATLYTIDPSFRFVTEPFALSTSVTFLRNPTLVSTGQTSFTLSYDLPIGVVFIDGVQQSISAYSFAAPTLLFTGTVASGSVVDVLFAAGSAAYSLQTFETAAALLADTTLDYANIVVGASIVTRKDGFAYEVAAAGATDHHVTTAGGVKLYAQEGAYGFDPRAFGAIGDGVADDTAFVSAAAQEGNVNLLNGYFKITSTITLPRETRTFYGKGTSDILFSPSVAPDSAFYLERINGTSGLVIFENVAAVTDVVDAGAFLEVAETRGAAGAFVVGAYDIARLQGCIVINSGTGYWRNMVRSVNAGGVVISQTTAANFNNTTAQANTNTAAIAIINDNADANLIRALYWDQSYTQRFQHAVYVNTVNSVESVYLGQGEMVGHFYGLRLEGSGKLGAVHINGTHMDCITSNIRTETGTNLNVLRATGHDLRLGSNGAALDNLGINIRINSGNYCSIVGGFFDAADTSTGQRGVVVVSDIPGLIIQSNNFRRHSVGVEGTSLTRATFDNNEFETVTTEYNVPVTPGINVDLAVSVDAQRYSGNLDSLGGGRRALTCVTTETGVTNLPSGVSATGNFVVTQVFDANAAYQQLYAVNGDRGAYVRRKGGGTWLAWQKSVVGTSAGWAAATGTGSRATFDTATVTTAQLAGRVKSLIEDLTTRGILGA